jgi:hypothetical protein
MQSSPTNNAFSFGRRSGYPLATTILACLTISQGYCRAFVEQPADTASRPNIVIILADDKAAPDRPATHFLANARVSSLIRHRTRLAAIAGNCVAFSGINYTLLHLCSRLSGRRA